MRQRPVLLLLAAISVALLIFARHQLRELAEVLRTYTTFYPYLRRHPETLYQYPNPEGLEPSRNDKSELVPPVIHQVFLSEGSDSTIDEYETAISSCQSLHPDWTHNLWLDQNASDFIAQHYPELWPHYNSYKQRIQRANILRYALLEYFGGVYLDLDITCLRPLDELRHLPFLTPGAHPAGVNNAFILSRPSHDFLRHLLDGVQKSDLLWGLPYIENMLSTGCMFFSNRWMSYARMSSRTREIGSRQNRVYVLADEHGKLAPHMLRGPVRTPLFRHGGASSWHEWDAAAILIIGNHYCYFLGMMALGASFASLILWRLSLRNKSNNMRWYQLRKRREMVDKSSDDGMRFV